MKNIISVSRRTDIPAFYTDWFIRRLTEQYVFVKNPYTKEFVCISLRPEDILGIVFWSKNFSSLLSRIDDVEKATKRLFFHFTITGLSKDIEINTPSYKEAIKDLIFIAKRYSPSNIIWRFDPICITDKISFQEHIESFRQCAEKLKGYVHTCYISFVHPYYKAIKNFPKYTTHKLLDICIEEKKGYSRQLAILARQYGLQIYACCNDYLLSDDVLKGGCININYLSSVWGLERLSNEKSTPTRKECICTKSIDIGAYDTCPHGCIYCYANSDKEKSTSFYKNHNPEWNALDGDVEDYEMNDVVGFERVRNHLSFY